MTIRGVKTLFSKTLVGMTFSNRQRKLPCFVQMSGVNLGRPYFLDKEDMVVGRDPRTFIHVHDPKVSRQHARLVKKNSQVFIVDLGSANGVRVNRRTIRRGVKLRD